MSPRGALQGTSEVQMKGKRTKDERKYNNLNIKHDTKVCLDTSTLPPPHKRCIKDGTPRYKTELRCTPTDGGRTRGIDLICLRPRQDTGALGTGDGLLREAGGGHSGDTPTLYMGYTKVRHCEANFFHHRK